MGTPAVVVAVASIIVVAAVQLPAWGMIGPNAWVGIRVKTSRRNRTSWRRVHQMAAPVVWLGAGVCWILLILGFVAHIIDPYAALPLSFASLLIGLLIGSWVAIARENAVSKAE